MRVLGILAREPLANDEPFGRETKYFSRIIELAGQRGVLAYVFWPQDIGACELATAYCTANPGMPARKSGWDRQDCPLPHVIYDRYSPVTEEEQARASTFRKQAEAQGIRFVNSPGFLALAADKWLTYRALVVHPTLRTMLPQTQLLTASTLQAMLDEFGHVYVKPVTGRQTRGVVSVRRDATRTEIHRIEPDGKVLAEAVKTDEVLDLRRLTGSTRAGNHIVQRAVEPGSFMGMRFEVRVMLHKRPAGHWLRTGMIVRAGSHDYPFLVPGHERHFRPSSVFPKAFGNRSPKTLDAIRALVRPVPSLLERHSGNGGEVAVDVIVDARGKPWILEVNSRPASLFLNVGAVRLRNRGIDRILDYAECLM